MAKSEPRSGENRGRRAADKRRAAEAQSAVTAPEVAAASANDRPAGGAAARGSRRPTSEEIAARAYEIYVTRGGTHGYDIEDWLTAERELAGK